MLRPLRQVEKTNVCFICPFTQEAGGLLSLATASGITFAQYSFQASGVFPLGVQLNDIENVNFSREIYPQRLRTTTVPCDTVGIGVGGDYFTDWVRIIGVVNPGDAAYVGPSGTFTNSTLFSGERVGHFLSTLEVEPHLVTMRGLGFSRQFVDPMTKEIVFENNPAHRVLVLSDGYIRVRLN